MNELVGMDRMRYAELSTGACIAGNIKGSRIISANRRQLQMVHHWQSDRRVERSTIGSKINTFFKRACFNITDYLALTLVLVFT